MFVLKVFNEISMLKCKQINLHVFNSCRVLYSASDWLHRGALRSYHHTVLYGSTQVSLSDLLYHHVLIFDGRETTSYKNNIKSLMYRKLFEE
jgi:hypothetical protein